VINVIRELHLRKVILIGHSIAGDVNLVAAVEDPSSIVGFIGIDNFKVAATPLPAEYQEQVKAIKENLKTDFANANEQYARMARISGRVIRDFIPLAIVR